MTDSAVVDASAMVDVLIDNERAAAVHDRLSSLELHSPAHFDSEVLSAFGRLHRAGEISAPDVSENLDYLAAAPIERHSLPLLLTDVWRRRESLRLVDALYVALAERLSAVLVTTDAALARAYDGAEFPQP
ncbi:MAG: type II toxin-antitoxin system VapC family toxin [Acidimicrobiia bacterium]